MKLAEQWGEILASLPRAWQTAWVALTLEDEADVERAALILGPAAPSRSHLTFRIDVARVNRGISPSPDVARRVFARLDREGIRGRLELVESEDEEARATDGRAARGSLAAQWQALIAELPPDWSHLYAQIDLDSSDFLERAALLLAPTNPLRAGGARSLRFRSARSVGYGVAVEMARRCFERLDRERITGRISIVHAVSDARPASTQGPVWRIGGRSV